MYIKPSNQSNPAGVIMLLMMLVSWGVISYMAAAQESQTFYNERMAAWQDTIVSTDEQRPNSLVATYRKDRFTYIDHYVLAKMVAGVKTATGIHWPEQAEVISVDNFPGGVKARYQLDDIELTTRIIPLPYGRNTLSWEGAAYYEVTATPNAEILLRVGGSKEVANGWFRKEWLRTDSLKTERLTISPTESYYHFEHESIPLTTLVKGSNSGKLIEVDDVPCVEYHFSGSGYVIISYGESYALAESLISHDVQASLLFIKNHYEELLQSRIITPEANMNEAFAHALQTLEYNWVWPWGWNECIHHWHSLWHMQHSGATDWTGQADRSRQNILSSAENLRDDGSVPHFSPAGMTRRDFGGSNQFYFWQIRNYWERTGDLETLRQIAPALDAILIATFNEYDPTVAGLLAWGQQIGNQEDFISTPYGGATPTMEAINMLEVRAIVADALDDSDKADECRLLATQMLFRLRKELWLSDLGRFAFFRDDLGILRLDGQYHTFIYPQLFGLVDALDGWSSMRHLRDRLIGAGTGDTKVPIFRVGQHPTHTTQAGGEVYCSNNFPNHVIGSWGMQAGAAQQPWGAWGLSSMGLNNEAYRPLRAIADWVMNDTLRGAWPEVSMEETAAYFSPPAGLYIQSTIEAIFGLRANIPENKLYISPALPDAWPAAELHLPAYQVLYANDGKEITYSIHTEIPMDRVIEWKLPVGSVTEFTVNGAPHDFKLSPWVNGVKLEAIISAEKNTRISFRFTPSDFAASHVLSIAEGDTLDIQFSGNVEILEVIDRQRILNSTRITDNNFTSLIAEDLLKDYLHYGKLGQLNFSRRSFFLDILLPAENIRFFHPVDLTILPRIEVYEYDAMKYPGLTDNGQIKLMLRNNTSKTISGTGHLQVAGINDHFPIEPEFIIASEVELDGRSEALYTFQLPDSMLGLLSSGENNARLLLPGQAPVPFKLRVQQPLLSEPILSEALQSRILRLDLPEVDLISHDIWRSLRPYYAFGHPPFSGAGNPMANFPSQNGTYEHPELPGVTFTIPENKFIPVSRKYNQPHYTIELNGTYKKLYLLVIPFLDNHDMFAPVARISLETTAGDAITRELYAPGDFDWFLPREMFGYFATSREDRPDRHGALPLLHADDADWNEGKPPHFPQPEFWTNTLVINTPGATFNIIEVDLGRPQSLQRMHFETVGMDPSFGLVAITLDSVAEHNILAGSVYEPPRRYLQPEIVFNFERSQNLEGWTLEGDAFSVTEIPSLFSGSSLNSLGKAGEMAIGSALSPIFNLSDSHEILKIYIQGGEHQATEESEAGRLSVELLDAETNTALATIYPGRSPAPSANPIDISAFTPREVRLRIIDTHEGDSYAWIGIQKVSLK